MAICLNTTYLEAKLVEVGDEVTWLGAMPPTAEAKLLQTNIEGTSIKGKVLLSTNLCYYYR